MIQKIPNWNKSCPFHQTIYSWKITQKYQIIHNNNNQHVFNIDNKNVSWTPNLYPHMLKIQLNYILKH